MAIRATQIQVEAVVQEMGEPMHQLDLAMDTKRPHWVWVSDILALYNSVVGVSNGLYKIVTERADLPVRQVFHAGNMAPGRTTAKIGGDPIRPNMAVVEFLDRDLNYQRDVRFLENSASVYGAKDPIKPFDMSLPGITRATEAARAGTLKLRRRRQNRREVSWVTGLEALAVEPGDVAITGFLTTNFEAGIGGRALDGSSTHVLLDREFDQKSGYSYDLWVWHTEADTAESRTVSSGTGIKISVTPSSGFDYQVRPNDRYAIGITSEDLIKVLVTRLRRAEGGGHELTGDEFSPAIFDILCPGSLTTATSNDAPSQPRSTSVAVVSGCALCVRITTVPGCIGARLPVPGTLSSVTLNASLHNPNPDALIDDTLGFISGTASGLTRTITDWGGSATNVATVGAAYVTAPNSGDQYYVRYRTPTLGGVFVEIDAGSGYVGLGTVFGNSGCVDILRQGTAMGVRLIPFSDRGARNDVGPWVFSVAAPACGDFDLITDPVTATGSAMAVVYGIVLPPDTLGTGNRVTVEADVLVTEACSPATETTDLALNFVYGSQTIVQSLVVALNKTTDWPVVGSDRAAFITAKLIADNNTARQMAYLEYTGPADSGDIRTALSGAGTINSTLPQTLAITAQFRHLDSGGNVESHNCFSLAFRSATLEVDCL